MKKLQEYIDILDSNQPLPTLAFLRKMPHEIVIELERRYGFFSCTAVPMEPKNVYRQELFANALLSSCFSAASWAINKKSLTIVDFSEEIPVTQKTNKLKSPPVYNDWKKHFSHLPYEEIIHCCRRPKSAERWRRFKESCFVDYLHYAC